MKVLISSIRGSRVPRRTNGVSYAPEGGKWWVTYTVCYKQDGHRHLILVPHQIKVLFESVKTGIANVDCISMSVGRFQGMSQISDLGVPRSKKLKRYNKTTNGRMCRSIFCTRDLSIFSSSRVGPELSSSGRSALDSALSMANIKRLDVHRTDYCVM